MNVEAEVSLKVCCRGDAGSDNASLSLLVVKTCRHFLADQSVFFY